MNIKKVSIWLHLFFISAVVAEHDFKFTEGQGVRVSENYQLLNIII